MGMFSDLSELNQESTGKNPIAVPTKEPMAQKKKQKEATKSDSDAALLPIPETPVQPPLKLHSDTLSPDFDYSPILSKAKGFYITEKQHQALSDAAEKLAGRVGATLDQKVDRSTILRLLLEEVNITSDSLLNKLQNRLVNRLVNRLTS